MVRSKACRKIETSEEVKALSIKILLFLVLKVSSGNCVAKRLGSETSSSKQSKGSGNETIEIVLAALSGYHVHVAVTRQRSRCDKSA